MAFVSTMDLSQKINISEIVRLRDDERGITVAELRDGTTVRLRLSVELVVRAACPVVPAQSGFELLLAYLDNDGVSYCREPIIGWRVTDACDPEPVVVDGWGFDSTSNAVATVVAIKYPDGRVVEQGNGDYASEAEWQAETEKRNGEYLRKERLRVVAGGNEPDQQ